MTVSISSAKTSTGWTEHRNSPQTGLDREPAVVDS